MLLSMSVRPYNPAHGVFVLALHLILFLRLTCVRINDDDDDDDDINVCATKLWDHSHSSQGC